MSYMIVNGVDSREYGLMVTNLPPVQNPIKRIQQIIIPGRSGYLTQWDGSYDDLIKPVELFYKGDHPEFIAQKLNEAQNITFSNEPDKQYSCRLDNGADIIWTIAKWHQFGAVFYCNPLKRESAPVTIELHNDVTTVINPGNHEAYPSFEIVGDGSVTIMVDGREVQLLDIAPSIFLDGNMQMCYQGEVLANKKMIGDYPIIPANKEVEIRWNGNISQIIMIPNWRWV